MAYTLKKNIATTENWYDNFNNNNVKIVVIIHSIRVSTGHIRWVSVRGDAVIMEAPTMSAVDCKALYNRVVDYITKDELNKLGFTRSSIKSYIYSEEL